MVAIVEGLRPSVTDVLCRTSEALSWDDKAFDGALDWTQASFTAQSDGTYVGRVRTRRKPTEVKFSTGSFRHTALLAHLREFFPGQYLSEQAAGDKLDDETTHLRGGVAQSDEESGYLTADFDGALPRAEVRVPGREEEEAREKEAVVA